MWMDKAGVVLVTGANRGIGLETCAMLVSAGHHVIVGCRCAEHGEQAASTLRKYGGKVSIVQLDVNDQGSVEMAADTIASRHGRLDGLVNNAATMDEGDAGVLETELSVVRTVLETNFFGVLRVVRAMVPLLKKSGEGRIVNLTDARCSGADGGQTGENGEATPPALGYGTSKAAVNLLTVLLAAELNRHGIKVNAADPGTTATHLTGFGPGQSAAEAAVLPAHLVQLGPNGPTGRVVKSS